MTDTTSIAAAAALPRHRGITRAEVLMIAASSLGGLFEVYDFFLYGLLTTVIASHFLSALNPTTAFIMALLVFAVGLIVRPLGAMLFGRIGDLVGRRINFLITLSVMGVSTFLVGLLPTYATAGLFAPILLVGLRLIQGLAMGGEYGGATSYVAEHAPANRRGLYTSWIQLTATGGLVMALLIVILTRSPTTGVGEAAFAAWGWRIPYLVSGLFLVVGLYLRLKLPESPVFRKMQAEGTSSKAPLTEAFGNRANLKIVATVFFGAITGQAVVWYTSQLYVLFFLEKMLRLDGLTANLLSITALALAAPCYLLAGWLSDRIGRKPVIMTGLLLAAISFFPVFHALAGAANPALVRAQAAAPVTVTAYPDECSPQFDPIGQNKFDKTGCDIVKYALAKSGVGYTNVAAPIGTLASVTIGDRRFAAPDPAGLSAAQKRDAIAAFAALVIGTPTIPGALAQAGYPAKADPAAIDRPLVILLLMYLAGLSALVYGPLAALLVELFPGRIRATSISLPYQLGNGWFGGLLPAIGFAMVAASGDIYRGLWYPVGIATLTLICGLLFLPETHKRDIDA
jgi:MFS family permease